MSVWKLGITRQEADNKACVIFIHGFQGNPKDTWADFPTLLTEDSTMEGWDVVSWGYESHLAPNLTGVWKADPSIQAIADSLGIFARTNLAPKYGVLVLIAHSMGGLAVQRALLDQEQLRNKVDKVILFGTPSFGLVKAWPFKLPFLRSLFRQVGDMAKGSDFIVKLRSDWDALSRQNLPFGFLICINLSTIIGMTLAR